MKRQHWFALCSLGLLLLGRGEALSQEDKKPLDPKMVDQKLYDALREVINHGADVYNRGDWAGCHRLYAGALMTSQAMLGHRPELQKAIADGLKAAEAEPVISEKAFVLRRVLDKVRGDLKGDATPVPEPKATVKGKVTLDGKPLVGGEVLFIDAKGAIKMVKTAPDGTYAIPDLAPGAYKVAVDGKDVPAKFKDAARSGLVTALKVGDNSFDLALKPDTPPPPATAVKGKVTVDGKPLTDGTVVLIDKDDKSTQGKVKDGSYEVKDLKPGTYKVAVRGTGVPAKFTDAAKSGLTVVIKSGNNESSYDLKPDTPPPPAPGTLKGKVTLNGKPLGDGTVTLVDKDNKSTEGKVKDGSYEIKEVKTGDYKVGIKGDGVAARYTDPTKSELTISVKSGSNTKDFDLKAEKPTPPPASVTGKVTLDGKPLGVGEVEFIDNAGKGKSGKLNADGTYRVADLPPGAYKVGVDARGIPPKYQVPTTSGFTADLKSGNNTLDLPLVSDKPKPTSGNVKGNVKLDGKPLAAGTIIFVDKDDKSTEGKITDGGYEVKNLKSGDYTIAVKGSGVPAKYTDADKSGLKVSVKDGSNSFDADIKGDAPPPPPPPPPAKDASVTGTITFKGKPLAKGDVTLVDEKGKPSKARINADGSYTLEKVQPGKYKVVVESDGVPEKFTKADTSLLMVEVKEGKNDFDVKLE